jgi:tRNA modification GTPase
MYDPNDTIVAVSSPTSGTRTIVRISGPATIQTCKQIFIPSITNERGGFTAGNVIIDAELKVDAVLYLFAAPRSYTGDDVAEIHIHTNRSVVEALMKNLLSRGLRIAGPGEFTARAYLNGKIDLAQAEAVNEVVVSSNTFQLAAAEKLLSGRLSETTTKVRSAMMDCLSLIEAGLDFSGEDIEFITRQQAAERLMAIKEQLERLLAGSISYESVVDLPAVGIAGAPNAGKSSMLNKLLGQERSIVSDERKTTRDVLTGLLTLAHCRCVLFDCAGLVPALVKGIHRRAREARRETIRYKSARRKADKNKKISGLCERGGEESPTQNNILDELAQQAAIEALRNSSVVIFCVDITKEDWSEDIAIRQLIQPKVLIPVATKSDLLSEKKLSERLIKLNRLFGADFLAISVKTSVGVEELRQAIDRKIIETALSSKWAQSRLSETGQEAVAITSRHRQAVTGAIENVNEAIDELKAGNDEVSAMMLRAAYQAISDIQQPICGRLDDEVLERIFSRFCIGK